MYQPYHLLLPILFFTVTISSSSAQELIPFKEVDSTQLLLEVYYPESFDTNQAYPALIFFFGGGWNGGDRSQFTQQAAYFAQRGLVCFLADYRTNKKHGTTPFTALKDAKSAIRFLRTQSGRFYIDPDKIVAAGGSAGGHLAAATALLTGYNDSRDDLSVSCAPNALVLFNPVIDNGPGGYGYERIGEAYHSFSPLHNIKRGAPPTLLLLGTKDHLVPVVTAKYYQTVMKKVGSRCDLKLYAGQKHGFFNYKHFEYYQRTVLEADRFLRSLGYLDKSPRVEIKRH